MDEQTTATGPSGYRATLLEPWRRAVFTPDHMTDGTPCWMAADPDLTGCVGYGLTQDDAMESLTRARRAYLRLYPDGAS